MSLETNAAIFIKKYEGYIDHASWDVNAYRLGHGSDTITSPDGSYRKVVKGDTTTREAAQRDLERRIKKEFIPKVAKQIGEPHWSKLPENAKIGLLSLAYNYGSVSKKAILDATKSGDLKKISQAIVDSTYNDNSKLPEKTRNVLRKRRADEASMVSSAWENVKEEVKQNPVGSSGVGMIFLGCVGLIVTGYLIKKQGGFKVLFSK
jgi:GH24 family phage-related lysozyme (muramidase)